MPESLDDDSSDFDLDEARRLLLRTVEFLDSCRDDPRAARQGREGEDPTPLIQGLQGLVDDLEGRYARDEDDPPIDFHRRRSA